ncbi:DUF434 domain-containing protein [Sulfolobus tengchongensis]|uniref:DUF434 domain-containing protein n=1 Tax=Sulfolobus tengchongensis TaxID=207809 RepID=A0AAX4KZE0_9CREN
MDEIDSLKEAYIDYKYFLNRGYPRKIALDAITARYNLSQAKRLLLYRCVHSDEEIRIIKHKIVNEKEIVVDGYNLALTLISAINGEDIFLCDDGFFRDLGLGKYKDSDMITDVLLLITEYCEKLRINCEIILDSQLSKSGNIISILKKKNINARTVTKADKEIIISSKAVYSNDFLILYKSQKISNVLNNMFLENYFKIFKGPWVIN